MTAVWRSIWHRGRQIFKISSGHFPLFCYQSSLAWVVKCKTVESGRGRLQTEIEVERGVEDQSDSFCWYGVLKAAEPCIQCSHMDTQCTATNYPPIHAPIGPISSIWLLKPQMHSSFSGMQSPSQCSFRCLTDQIILTETKSYKVGWWYKSFSNFSVLI